MQKPLVGPRAMGTGDAWALCSIVWEKPALLGHGVMMTLKGHKLPVPPRLSHTIPLLYLTPSATEHPIIHIPPSLGSLSTQQTRVPEFQDLGFEHPAVDSCATALCIQQHSPHCMLPRDVLFHSEEQISLIFPPQGCRVSIAEVLGGS